MGPSWHPRTKIRVRVKKKIDLPQLCNLGGDFLRGFRIDHFGPRRVPRTIFGSYELLNRRATAVFGRRVPKNTLLGASSMDFVPFSKQMHFWYHLVKSGVFQ